MLCSRCSETIRPVIALDIDGTVSDYHGAFLRFAARWLMGPASEQVFGLGASHLVKQYDGSQDLATYLGVSKEVYRQIKLAYRQGGGKRFQPVLGDHAALASLMAWVDQLDVELWITTTRPYNRFDSTDPDTRQWLDWHGIQFQGLIYDEDKYQVLSNLVDPERIVMVVDDDGHQFDRATELELPILFRRNPYNRATMREPSVGNLWEVKSQLQERIDKWMQAM